MKTIQDFAEMVRMIYPDAVSVNVFVNHGSLEIDVKYQKDGQGFSMRKLNGDWVHSQKQEPVCECEWASEGKVQYGCPVHDKKESK